jgi:hypothetical protein
MSVYVFSSQKMTLPGPVQTLPPDALGKHSPQPGDISYLDIAAFTGPELKKALALLKRRCKDSAWGIIDPGDGADPAAFFFEGASDYLGSKILKAGADKKRFKAALSWKAAGEGKTAPPGKKTPGAGKEKPGGEPFFSKPGKLPAGKFAGWNSVGAGSTSPFFFLYVSLSGKTSLRSRLGEGAFKLLMGRLRNFLIPGFQDAKALLWMETETNCLFLIPPKAEYAKIAVTEALKILMGTPMITLETFGLSVPADFTFALHYGKTQYRAPGKTGTVVSDAVNFIFHLGAKRAESGRLTLSDDVPGEAFPPELADMFTEAGAFEGRNLLHSRRFIYSQV